MATKGIFCLEGLWDNDLKKKSSVQPILNMLEVNSGIPYIHQDVATVEELEFYLSRWKQPRYRNYPILYLAFHGENEALLIGKYEYTLDHLSNFLGDSCKNAILILASCSTLRTDIRNIRRFLRKTNALAICGYKAKVNWMLAAAFELLVLSSLQQTEFSGRGIRAIERQVKIFGSKFSGLDFTIVTKMENSLSKSVIPDFSIDHQSIYENSYLAVESNKTKKRTGKKGGRRKRT